MDLYFGISMHFGAPNAFLLYQTTTSTYTINKIDFHCLIAFEILYTRLRSNSRLSYLCSLIIVFVLLEFFWRSSIWKIPRSISLACVFSNMLPFNSTIVLMSIAILEFYWHQKIRGRVYINNI